MKILRQPALLLLITLCSCQSPKANFDQLPKEWIQLTKVDQNFIHVIHKDSSDVGIRIKENRQLELFSGTKTTAFHFTEVEHKDINYVIKLAFKKQTMKPAEAIFHWVNPKKQIGQWYFVINKDTIINSYFASRAAIDQFPSVLDDR